LAAKIRLQRMGSKSKPFYRVVVMDESSPRDSETLEILGIYDPRKKPSLFEVDKEKVESWLKKGALPTDTIRKYLGKIGILAPVNFDKKPKRQPKKAQAAAEQQNTAA